MKYFLVGALLFVSLAALTNCVVHRIQTKHVSIPKEISSSKAKYSVRPTKALDIIKKSVNPRQLALIKDHVVGSIDVDADCTLLVGNIQLGTPEQNFLVNFDSWRSDVYFIATNASLAIIGNYGSKAKYDQSASSTAVNSGALFNSDLGTIYGRVVNDEINLGGAKAAVNVGIADGASVFAPIGYLPIDAQFGLIVPEDDSEQTNVLTQIAHTLDRPIVTTFSKREFGKSGEGEITIGDENTNNCEPNYSYTPQLNKWQDVKLNSVSLGDKTVAVSAIVEFYNWHSPIFVTSAVHKLFVAASGAVYKPFKFLYEVDCDQSANKESVIFNLGEDGKTALVLDPKDYIAYSDLFDVCYLNVFAVWPDSLASHIALGQNFLNNHCIAHNINERTVGFSRVKENKGSTTESPATNSPTTTISAITTSVTADSPLTTDSESSSTSSPIVEFPTEEPKTTQETETNTDSPTTAVPTTETATTVVPTTEASTTAVPITEAPITESPTTAVPNTESPSTITTEVPITIEPTTELPTTES